MQTEQKNNEKKRHQREGTNCLQKCFLSFMYVTNHKNVCFFFLNSLWPCSNPLNEVYSLHRFVWFLLYYSLHFLRSDHFAALYKFITIKKFYLNIWIFKKSPTKKSNSKCKGVDFWSIWRHKLEKLPASFFFFFLVFTPCKAEQPLRGMELQEKEALRDYITQEICLERTYS